MRLGERCAPATAAGYGEAFAIRGESDVIWGDIHADGACHEPGFGVYHSDCIADAECDKGLLTICGNGDSGDLRVFEALSTSGKSSGDIWRFVILKWRVHNPCCTGCWTSISCDIDDRDLATRLRGEDAVAIRHPCDAKRSNANIHFSERLAGTTIDGDSTLAECGKAFSIWGNSDVFWAAASERDDRAVWCNGLVRWCGGKSGA